MKAIAKWCAVGIIELVFCFWLLGNAASLVSSPSNIKVWLGLGGYLIGFSLPIASTGYVAAKLQAAKRKQKQMRSAFPDDETTLIQLLDIKE